MYSIERLTAPDPKWDFALIFITGMEDPIAVDQKTCKAEYIRIDHLVKVTIPRIMDPSNPATEGGMGPNGPIPARPGGLASMESYIHEDEITTISFYHCWTPEEYEKAGIKARSIAEHDKEVMGKFGETEEDQEAKKEELLKKQKEQLGLKTGEEPKKSKLKKAD